MAYLRHYDNLKLFHNKWYPDLRLKTIFLFRFEQKCFPFLLLFCSVDGFFESLQKKLSQWSRVEMLVD